MFDDFVQKIKEYIANGFVDVVKNKIQNYTVETGHQMLSVIMNGLLFNYSDIMFDKIEYNDLKRMYHILKDENDNLSEFFLLIKDHIKINNSQINELYNMSDCFIDVNLPIQYIKPSESLTQQLIDGNKSQYEVIMGLLFEFKYGTGPMERLFDDKSLLTNELKKLDVFMEKKEKFDCFQPLIIERRTQVEYQFGVQGLLLSGNNLAKQYIGGFYFEMYSDDDKCEYVNLKAYNDVNLKSLVLHYLGLNDINTKIQVFPEKYPRLQTITPLGETRQIFIWKEKLKH